MKKLDGQDSEEGQSDGDSESSEDGSSEDSEAFY